jgi:GxxExxY protein
MTTIIYKEESFRILGACFEVYNQKGFGFTEPVYQECLSFEFSIQEIPFVGQPEVNLSYKGKPLTQFFKPDFICYEKIIVELKTASAIVDAHRAQTINYLNALGFELAILVNFGQFPRLAYERLANTKRAKSSWTVSDEIQSWTTDEWYIRGHSRYSRAN